MAEFITASDAFEQWKTELLSGKSPTFYRIADYGPLSKIEIGPKLVTLFGGPPGAGKTAFIMQAVFDAMRLDEDLRTVVCNVEMGPGVLLDRQLSRLSGVPLDHIRNRSLDKPMRERVEIGLAAMDQVLPRLCFVQAPYTLANIAESIEEFTPSMGYGGKLLIVADYIQRIPVDSKGSQGDRRGSIDAAMSYLRAFAEAGAAVLVVSSVGRQKDNAGRSSYSGEFLNLASFKESGELEFGVDDAYILTASDSSLRTLLHLKARYGETGSIKLGFNGSVQQFEAFDTAADNDCNEELMKEVWGDALPAGGEIWKG